VGISVPTLLSGLCCSCGRMNCAALHWHEFERR
jgi:hypothetical protein